MKRKSGESKRAKAYVDRVLETQRKFGSPPAISEEEYRSAIAAAEQIAEPRTRKRTAVAG